MGEFCFKKEGQTGWKRSFLRHLSVLKLNDAFQSFRNLLQGLQRKISPLGTEGRRRNLIKKEYHSGKIRILSRAVKGLADFFSPFLVEILLHIGTLPIAGADPFLGNADSIPMDLTRGTVQQHFHHAPFLIVIIASITGNDILLLQLKHLPCSCLGRGLHPSGRDFSQPVYNAYCPLTDCG